MDKRGQLFPKTDLPVYGKVESYQRKTDQGLKIGTNESSPLNVQLHLIYAPYN